MNKQMLITVLLVVPLLLLLNACVPTFRTPDTPTQIPSSALTNTTRPTEQETTTFSPTSKPTLTLTASNTANTAVSKMPSPTPDPYDKILLSPDGRYVAKLYSEYNYITGRPTIEVLDNSGSLLWTIPYQRVMPTGDPHPYLRMHEWSSDSLTLYFYYAFHYDGVYTLWDGFDLQSIQVTTGRIQHIVPGAGLMAFAFSPNEQYVAYTRNQDQPRCLIVRNLANGGESKILALSRKGSDKHRYCYWRGGPGDPRFQSRTNRVPLFRNLGDAMQRNIGIRVEPGRKGSVKKRNLAKFARPGSQNLKK